jgi:hypothetical protein
MTTHRLIAAARSNTLPDAMGTSSNLPGAGAPVRMNLFMRFHHSGAVDAVASLSYKPPMICARPRLMATIDSRGFAVGPEGMRVR